MHWCLVSNTVTVLKETNLELTGQKQTERVEVQFLQLALEQAVVVDIDSQSRYHYQSRNPPTHDHHFNHEVLNVGEDKNESHVHVERFDQHPAERG